MASTSESGSDSESDMAMKDAESIMAQLADEEERKRLKLRYVLGDHLSEAELEKAGISDTQFLPESLLRKGDIFYEELGNLVGIPKSSQDSTVDHGELEDVYLGSLTDHALFQIATIVNGGGSSSSFERTRPEMKQVVKEWLKRKKKDGDDEIAKQVEKVVSDPRNYQEGCGSLFTTPISVSPREAALKILKEPDGLSNKTLYAMRTELTKGSGKVPGRNDNQIDLVEEVRQASEKFICQGGEELPEQLAKAIVDLSRSSRNVASKEAIEEKKEKMRECILNLSAGVKGLLLERIPDYEIDQDYADAKGDEDEDDEEDEDDDEDDDDEDDDECSFMESTDVSPEVVIRDLPESSSSRIPLDKPESSSSRIPLDKPTLVSEKEVDSNPGTSKKKNQHLALEGISDETSLLAFDLIGCILEKYKKEKKQASSKSKKKKRQDKSDKQASSSQDKSDGSILISAAREKIPSIDERTIMELQELFEVDDRDTVSHPPTAAQNQSRKKHKSDVKGKSVAHKEQSESD